MGSVVLTLDTLDSDSACFSGSAAARAVVGTPGSTERRHPVSVSRVMPRSAWAQAGSPTTLEVTL